MKDCKVNNDIFVELFSAALMNAPHKLSDTEAIDLAERRAQLGLQRLALVGAIESEDFKPKQAAEMLRKGRNA